MKIKEFIAKIIGKVTRPKRIYKRYSARVKETEYWVLQVEAIPELPDLFFDNRKTYLKYEQNSWGYWKPTKFLTKFHTDEEISKFH